MTLSCIWVPVSAGAGRVVVLAFALGLAWSAVGSSALAEPEREPGEIAVSTSGFEASPEGYEAAIDIAFQEYKLGNYAEARSRFLDAHRIYPNARTLRALGIVAYELRNYVSSILYLEQALSSSERPLTPRLRAETEQLLKKAQGYVARYTVSLRPRDAAILIDGSEAEPDEDGALVLEVGDHVLEAVAPGHRSLKRVLRVVGGADESISMMLVPLESSSPGTSPRSGERVDVPLRKRWWLWTTLSAVVLGGVATGLSLALRDPGERTPNGGTLGTVIPVDGALLGRNP